jgi:hypothetical protein
MNSSSLTKLWVHGLLRDRPLPREIPPLHLLMPTDRAIRIEAIAVGALPVAHLTAGVARVGQDRQYGGQPPCLAAAVQVTLTVHMRRTRYTVVVELPGDAGNVAAFNSPGEDPANGRCGHRIGFEPVQPPSPAGVGAVRMWAGVVSA